VACDGGDDRTLLIDSQGLPSQRTSRTIRGSNSGIGPILRLEFNLAFKCARPAYNSGDMTNATLKAVQTWAEMIKFAHSVFALPFALIATFMAGRANEGGLPTVTQVLLILLCMAIECSMLAIRQ